LRVQDFSLFRAGESIQIPVKQILPIIVVHSQQKQAGQNGSDLQALNDEAERPPATI
jgi:hypothetical protein